MGSNEEGRPIEMDRSMMKYSNNRKELTAVQYPHLKFCLHEKMKKTPTIIFL